MRNSLCMDGFIQENNEKCCYNGPDSHECYCIEEDYVLLNINRIQNFFNSFFY